MSKPYWKGEDRNRVGQILRELTADGKEHTWLRDPLSELQMRAIASTCRPWRSGDIVRWDAIRNAVNACIRSKNADVTALESHLDAAWDANHKARSEHLVSYRVVIAVDIVVGVGVQLPFVITSLGQQFELRSFRNFEESFGKPLSELDMSVRLRTGGPAPAAYAVMEVPAASADAALDQALSVFELWRAAMNFAECFMSWHIQFVPHSRAAIPMPSWVVALRDSEQISPVTYGGVPFFSRVRPPKPFSIGHFQVAASVLHAVTAQPSRGSMAEHIADGLRLLGVALDQEVWHHSLFMFWQLAEHLTVIDGAREKHDEICKRLPLMQPADSPKDPTHLTAALRGIMQIRHAIVHRGEFGDAFDDDVTFLQECCVEALWWLFRRQAVLRSREDLRMFFQYANLTRSQHERVQHILSVMEQLKNGPADPSGGIASEGSPPADS